MKFQEAIDKIRARIDKTNPDGTVDGSVVFFRNFLAGGTSASIAVTSMAPMERIKLILQTQNHRSKAELPPEKIYKGLWDCLIRLPKEQGYFSYWRGNFASVLRCFPYYALNFAFKDKYKDYFVRDIDKHTHMLKRFIGNVLSGGIAGASAITFVYPLDYARTRLGVSHGKAKSTRDYRGIWHCLSDTFKKDGIYGLYRGFLFSFFGVFVYRSIYFGLYDTGKDLIAEEQKHNIVVGFCIAEVAATSSGFLSYPLDTVRRTMMMQSGKKNRDYKSSTDCMIRLFKEKGLRGFYHGSFTNVLRGTGGAMMLVLYDELHRELWPNQESSQQDHIPPLVTMLLPSDDMYDDYFEKDYHDSFLVSHEDVYVNVKRQTQPSVLVRPSRRIITDLSCCPADGASSEGQDDNTINTIQTCPARKVVERIDHICDF